ncbi:MAG: GTPase HflX [Clostridia bacterium]|nr:GTPase HflX [Clostridia bacterium]
MDKDNIPEGLPFYIEVFETSVKEEEPIEDKEERNKLHEVAPSAVRKAVTVSVFPQGGEAECLSSLEELSRLLDTAGASVAAIITQMRPSPDPRFGIGRGKMAELSDACKNTGAQLVVFDFELSPSQIREIENAIETEVSVLDRSMLILDIFAMRAQSSEGRLQVELAQLKYTAPRLMGKGKDMSRLGGGIGTRGPGESKLEIDRRRLKTRIAQLEEELRKVEKNRATVRQARERSGITKCAIVGYTNAGKSTLLNLLTGAGILAEDRLFATLDPTTRQYELPGGTKILLTDTVGFIKNLPHHLIKAFRSTLDEARLADILIIVCDASDGDFADRMIITENLLSELNASGKPTLYVFNKCDKVEDAGRLAQMKRIAAASGSKFVFISALTGEGTDDFARHLESLCRQGKRTVTVLLPQSEMSLLNQIYRDGESVTADYLDSTVKVTFTCDEKLYGRIKDYIYDE